MNALRTADRAKAGLNLYIASISGSGFISGQLIEIENKKVHNNHTQKLISFTLGDMAIGLAFTLVFSFASNGPSLILRLAPRAGEQARPSVSAGSGWNECRGSAGRVEKRVRSINQPPPWWTSIPHLSTRGGEHPDDDDAAGCARAAFPRHTTHHGIHMYVYAWRCVCAGCAYTSPSWYKRDVCPRDDPTASSRPDPGSTWRRKDRLRGDFVVILPSKACQLILFEVRSLLIGGCRRLRSYIWRMKICIRKIENIMNVSSLFEKLIKIFILRYD